MTQIESLTRRNLVLGVVAVLLLGYVVFRPSETSAVTTESLPELFPELKAEEVRTVILERESGEGAEAKLETVRIQREDETGWVLASAHGYPANPEKVNRFLEDLQGTRRKKFITERADTFGEYAGPKGWTHVQVLGAGGKTVADFRLGKSAGWPDSFALVTEDGKDVVVRAYNLSATDVRLDDEAWTEARLWPGLTLPDVGQISVAEGYGDASLVLERQQRAVEPKEGETEEDGEKTETVWVMALPQEAEVEQPEADNLVRSFTGMRFSRIVGRWMRGEDEDLYGLTEPSRIVTVRGPKSTPEQQPATPKPLGMLLVGKAVPADGEEASSERVYVMRDSDRWVFEVTAASVADFRKSPSDFLPAADEPEEPAAPAPGGDAHGSPDDGGAPEAPIPPGGGPPLPPDDVAPPDAPGPAETPGVPEVPEKPDVPPKPGDPAPPEDPKDG